MKAGRAVLFSLVLAAAAVGAHADEAKPPPTAYGTVQGPVATVGPGRTTQRPKPLFMLGNLSVGIWAPVAPPYDATANRNLAADMPW